MALKKSVQCKCGLSGEYLKLTLVNLDGKLKKVSCLLAVYKDKAASDAGAEPVETRPIAPYTASDAALESVYAHLKSLPAYSGSEDC
jgi:hypothetical protein